MSRAGNMARNVSAIMAGGSLYLGSVYIGYTYYVMNRKETDTEFSSLQQQHDSNSKQPQHLTNSNSSCDCQNLMSHVDDPLRSNRFNTIAGVYDDEIDRDEFYTGIHLLRRWLLYFHARGTVLEVGAGTGRNIRYYPKAVRRVLLADSSAEMLQQAQRKILQEQQQRFAVLQTDAMTLQTSADNVALPDNAFDTVVDTFGLCSYNDPVAVLRQMSRVCKTRGGRILLLEHGRSKSYDFVNNHLDKHAEYHAQKWGCVWNRDLDGILQECERQGFLRVETRWTWHFGTTYYVVCRPV